MKAPMWDPPCRWCDSSLRFVVYALDMLGSTDQLLAQFN